MNRIVLFTANKEGGIIQLAMELLRDLSDLNNSVLCFVPSTANYSISEKYKNKVVTYDLPTSKIIKKVSEFVPNNKFVRTLIQSVCSTNPNLFWTLDDLPLTCQVGIGVQKRINTWMTVHDPLFHLSNSKTTKQRIYILGWKRLRKKYANTNVKILLLSQQSMDTYRMLHGEQNRKYIKLELGAHIPDVEGIMPKEMVGNETDYLLFFGRIEKYKGIDTLVRTFCNTRRGILCIAGKGDIQESVKIEIEKHKNIVLINRFINDNEMIWLFENASALVLPYIEASQSGIIPIAYYYGKPVVVSNVDGLKQYVVDSETGFVCKTDEEYNKAYNYVLDENLKENFRHSCIEYYRNRLDWKANLSKIIGQKEE